jgi:septal ring-binding cell division protein DamX
MGHGEEDVVHDVVGRSVAIGGGGGGASGGVGGGEEEGEDKVEVEQSRSHRNTLEPSASIGTHTKSGTSGHPIPILTESWTASFSPAAPAVLPRASLCVISLPRVYALPQAWLLPPSSTNTNTTCTTNNTSNNTTTTDGAISTNANTESSASSVAAAASIEGGGVGRWRVLPAAVGSGGVPGLAAVLHGTTVLNPV